MSALIMRRGALPYLILALLVALGLVWQRTHRRNPLVAIETVPARVVEDEGGLAIGTDLSPVREQPTSDTESRDESIPGAHRKSSTIRGTVETVDGAPLASVLVRLDAETKGPVSSTYSGLDGSFAFDGVLPERYLVTIDAATLPAGWQPPMHQDKCALGGYPRYAYSPCVDVEEEGSEHEVTLLAFPCSRISGRVIGPRGEPVLGLAVRLQSVEAGGQGICFDAKTGEDGAYAFDCAYPAQWRVLVFPSEDTPYFGMPRPSSDPIQVLPQEEAVVSDLVFQLGDRAVFGTVVNQFHEPVERAQVICYEWPGTWANAILIARTEPDGTFQLAGLPRRQVAVQALAGRAAGVKIVRGSEPSIYALAESPVAQQSAELSVRTEPLRELVGRVKVEDPVLAPEDLQLMASWFDGSRQDFERIPIEGPEFRWRFWTASPRVALHLSYAPRVREEIRPALIGRVVEAVLTGDDTGEFVLVFP